MLTSSEVMTEAPAIVDRIRSASLRTSIAVTPEAEACSKSCWIAFVTDVERPELFGEKEAI
jgi:hypothetical protein